MNSPIHSRESLFCPFISQNWYNNNYNNDFWNFISSWSIIKINTNNWSRRLIEGAVYQLSLDNGYSEFKSSMFSLNYLKLWDDFPFLNDFLQFSILILILFVKNQKAYRPLMQMSSFLKYSTHNIYIILDLQISIHHLVSMSLFPMNRSPVD